MTAARPQRDPLPRTSARDVDATTLDETLLHIAERIESLLEEERQLLTGTSTEGFDRIVERKNYLALEVARLTQHAGRQAPTRPVRRMLDRTAVNLERNADLLRRHIEAVTEIAAVVSEIYNRSTGDGTYTNTAARGGRKP